MSEKSKKQKVSIVEKMGLFMVCAGNIPLMGLLSGFFMIYYTNVVGLEPAALATLFLISKVVDGISDPIMGYFLDKFPVTKMGKFRPMIILGTIICVINYILLWFGAVWIPVGKYVIVYVTYLLLGWTFDIMDISKNSLLPVMSADDKERNSLSLFNALGTMIGSAVLAVAAPILPQLKSVLGEDNVSVRIYDNLGHGFGIGSNTIVPHWFEEAVEFWEAHRK